MGCWNETCHLTRMPIMERDHVVMIPIFGCGGGSYTYAVSGHSPMCLPIKGRYDGYGSVYSADESLNQNIPIQIMIQDVAQKVDSCIGYSILGTSDHKTVRGMLDIIRSSELDCCAHGDKDMDGWCSDYIMIHKVAYDRLVDHISYRKFGEGTFAEKISGEFHQCKLIFDSIDPGEDGVCEIDVGMVNIEKKLKLNNLGRFYGMIDYYIKCFERFEEVKQLMIELHLLSTAFEMARISWTPDSGRGSQSSERMMQLVNAQSAKIIADNRFSIMRDKGIRDGWTEAMCDTVRF